jgi:hypothetical protein
VKVLDKITNAQKALWTYRMLLKRKERKKQLENTKKENEKLEKECIYE